MTDMQDPLFDLPDEAKDEPQLSDFNGILMLFRPTGTKMVDTSFGPSDVTIADVVVITPAGKLVSLPQTFIFWKGVQEQLARALGTNRWVAGILRQGAGRNNKAWSLGAPTVGEQMRLADVMNSAEFRGIVDQNADVPF